MKHNYIIRLAIIALILLPISIKAADPVRVHGINYELIGDEATVTSYGITYSGVLTIPSSINYNGRTYQVTSIGSGAFFDCTDLISITIPESVISIDRMAFYGCRGLTTISIPDNLTIICDGAFENCSRLSSVTIGSGLTSLGTGVFNNCAELSTIKVKAENKCFDSRNNCNAIIETSSNKLIAGCNKTVIPNGVTSIEFNAFYGCSGLTSVTIPNSVKFIGHHAFYNCSDLTSVTISSTINQVDNAAFKDCYRITDVYCYAERVPYASVTSTSTDDYYGRPITIYGSFDGISFSSVTLHVPEASISSYQSTAPWSSFGTIVALTDEDADGIMSTNAEEDAIWNINAEEDAIWNINANTGEAKAVYYDTNGRQSDRPHRGINIIRYSDGTTRKVLIK